MSLGTFIGRDNFLESFTIREIGMRLSKEARQEIKQCLSRFELRTPVASRVNFVIRKYKYSYEAKLIVSGLGTKFFEKMTGETPLELYRDLERKIDSELLKWKKLRFRKKSENQEYQHRIAEITA